MKRIKRLVLTAYITDEDRRQLGEEELEALGETADQCFENASNSVRLELALFGLRLTTEET